ncbi:hypothetical protein E4K67_23080 [Desulfosporosinus fructosivorans]|uniref:Uncharacterized protein n=1 Tax=Desulfosporosinus fructosivorans TaxID=2018669 RepID=A0A4Z0R1X0_9FIRM|nr:hypothetical protein [Desulfosporosinus fructosivorans]TGE35997.1 hypothetical protein E4K67_23080 [Desulfosporosinus fructosivorans]
MKETNVWLSPKELQDMLQGSLQWIDVATRVTTAKNGIRKLGETIYEKESTSMQTMQPTDYLPMEKSKPYKQLEGQPVIWLLGSVGLLTLSSWFYYVLFTK